MNKQQAWPHVKVTIDDTGAVVDPLFVTDDGAFLARLIVWGWEIPGMAPARRYYAIAVRHRDLGLRLGDAEAAQLATAYLVKTRGTAPASNPIVL